MNNKPKLIIYEVSDYDQQVYFKYPNGGEVNYHLDIGWGQNQGDVISALHGNGYELWMVIPRDKKEFWYWKLS